MKTIIIPILDQLKASLDSKEFKGQKTLTKSINLNDYDLNSLNAYVKDNNIKDGVFCTEGDYNADPIYCWDEKIDVTKEESEQRRQKFFNGKAFRLIYDAMTKAGYKRIGCNTLHLRQFDKDTVFSMYVNGDYDRLVTYYSLFFSL